jgi:hypothetical protein
MTARFDGVQVAIDGERAFGDDPAGALGFEIGDQSRLAILQNPDLFAGF